MIKLNLKTKKGLSPIIITILLVLLTIIVASIIYVWLTSFLKEGLTKSDQPIERSCDNINLEVSSSNGILYVTNNGNVAIYMLKLSTINSGTSELKDLDSLGIGQSKSFDISGVDIASAKIVSVLLGNSKNNEVNEFQCPKTTWKSIA